jgi:hypothetical protein
MNITSSYGDYGYGDYGYGDYGYGNYGYGDYGYGGSSIIDNSTNMFPSIEPSITISTPPTRVILSIMTNSPTSNGNISITEENYTLDKAKSRLMFGLVLGVALLGGITTSFVFHKLRTYLKKPQNIEEEPIFATDITIVKEDEL